MMSDTPEGRRARLRDLLRERAINHGDFTLASDRRSSYYLDGRLVTLHHEGAYLVACVTLDTLKRERIEADAIGGLTMGADPMAGAVAAVSPTWRGPPCRPSSAERRPKGTALAGASKGTCARVTGSWSWMTS
ncbi:MAG TPA: hypothetical protein VGK94_03425 [Candidatus Polarisedimenticolia bacterium]|jgi:orotate phosphoribosyltransferase